MLQYRNLYFYRFISNGSSRDSNVFNGKGKIYMLNTDQKILFEILIKLKEKLSHRSLPPKPSLFLSIESIEIRILVFDNKM